ncbi:MAG: WD40/YVTN/BNR-like repeat-containing protein [Janthinobacterium lividum]
MRLLSWMKISCAVLAAGLSANVCRAAAWFPLGPFGGSARSLVADPADAKHLFLGTATGWVYDSHDGGISWTRVAQVASRNDLVIDHIVVDAKNPKRLVVGAFTADHLNDGGVFISEDYGKTWYSQAEMRGQSIRALARSSSNSSELIAGTLKGVFRSMDNGVHWQQISPEGSGEIKEVESVAIDPVDPKVIYAGTWHLPWKTTDGGATWHNIKEGIIDDSDVFSIIVDPQKPNIVYASACSGIYKSSDAGDLFHKVQGIPSAARRTRTLEQDPENLQTVFAGTTEGLYRTLDAGEKWERLTPDDMIVNDVYVDPTNAQHVLLATDRGGVYRSEDGGTTFEPSNNGFSARQITAFAVDAQAADTLYVGVVNDKKTGGVFQSTDGAVHWQQQSEGLGGRDIFSLVSLTDGTLLAGTGHGIFRLNGGNWTDSSTLDPSIPVQKTAIASVVGVRHVPVVRTSTHKPLSPVRKTRVATKPVIHSRKPTPVAAHGRPHLLPVKARGKSATAIHSKTVPRSRVAPPTRVVTAVLAAHRVAPSAAVQTGKSGRIDAVVYDLARTGDDLFAGTSTGLLRSHDGGQHWSPVTSLALPEVHFVALETPASNAPASSPGQAVLVASLDHLVFSPDGGNSWGPVTLPSSLRQIGAVGIDGDKNIWVGGREGVWFSPDNGATWKTLRNLFVTQVDSIFYDPAQQRVLVTASTSPVVFSVHVPDDKVTYFDTGWKLRFVRPVGDHLVGATLFDGVVVQPEMVDSAAVPAPAAPK